MGLKPVGIGVGGKSPASAEGDSTVILREIQIMVLIMLPRKASNRYAMSKPYRKPTQVVEESILRCSSDPWLRN